MVNYVYTAVDKYFNTLTNTGYMKLKDVNKLLLLCSIQELLDNDFRGLVNLEDYNLINNALYCLYGTSCLMPYPDYYSGKNKRVMYLGSISELACRVNKIEENDAVQDERLDTLEDDVSSIKGRLDDVEGDVNNIMDTVVIVPSVL